MMITLEQAALQESSYRARQEFRRPLGATVLNAVVGPTGVGKNFLMAQSGLPVVGTLTTREKRATDGTGYRYASVANILEKIERGELIQYGVNQPNIYSSELLDYMLDTPNVTDIYSSAVYSLENKGFEKVQAISVLTSRAQWMSQLTERFEGMENGKILGRLDEARQSLRWVRLQQLGIRATNHLVVINRTDNVEENIEKIQAFAHSKTVDRLGDETVISYLEGMDRSLDVMYGRLGVKLS